MKRLFAVAGMFFDNKQQAKFHRDWLRELHETDGVSVRLGPDHRLFGVKKVGKTHSHNARSGGHGNGFPKKARRFN
jgi:hypothetical protein